MRIVKQRVPIYNTITKQIEYREMEFAVDDKQIYSIDSMSTAINYRII